MLFHLNNDAEEFKGYAFQNHNYVVLLLGHFFELSSSIKHVQATNPIMVLKYPVN